MALEALRGDRTVQQIAARHEVHPNQVSLWKRQAVDGLAGERCRSALRPGRGVHGVAGGGRLADRMLELVLHGVSTREYETVLPAMADQAGVSKSEVSRETIESGTRVLRELSERDLRGLDVLVVYLDGIVFGDYHVLAAVGVDAEGRKHVLGVRGGASENAEVTVDLLEDLVARGLRAGSWSSMRRGWSRGGRRRRRACARGCRSCSRSTAWGCRGRCAAA